MGGTHLEPNIFPVKNTFFALKQLIDSGFDKRQVTIIVDNLPQNNRGIMVLRLMLKIFTEYRDMGMILRYMQVLTLKDDRGIDILRPDNSFPLYFNSIISQYNQIINVDTNPRYLIGQHELQSVGLNNLYTDENGIQRRYITYRGRQIVSGVRFVGDRVCVNKCILCNLCNNSKHGKNRKK